MQRSQVFDSQDLTNVYTHVAITQNNILSISITLESLLVDISS